MLKKFLIGILAVMAFVFTANLALASYDFGSAILKVGSRGQYVTTLQNLVGATPVDGVFGPKTKAKVVAWQVANGLTADGLFGNLSKAKANETGTNFRAGCTNASGFSTTTGLPCSSLNANTFSTGCTNASGFSTTTGLPCSSLNANTFPAGCTNASGFSTKTGLACTSANANTFPVGCSNASGFSTTTDYSCLTGFPATTIIRSGGGGSSHHDTLITAIGAITGTLQVGQVLTAGTVTPSGATVSYQWQIGDIAGGLNYPNIEGATSSTYTILESDVGKYLDVTATGTGNYSGSVKSAPTTVITLADIATAGVTGFVAPITGATPQAFGTLTAVGATYSVTGLTWSPVHNPYQGLTAYTATVTLTSDANYKFPVGNIASPTADVGTVNSIGTTAGGNASGNTLSYTVLFPATVAVPIIATVSTITAGEVDPSIVITLSGDTFGGEGISDQAVNWTFDYGTTGLARKGIDPIVFNNSNQETFYFTGTAAAGTITLTPTGGVFTGGVASNPISITVPAATLADATSAFYTTSGATTAITITLSEGSFRADGGDPIDKNDFIFAGTDAIAIATNGGFTRISGMIVKIMGLETHLAGGGDNKVTVLGATQASQVTTVTATIE